MQKRRYPNNEAKIDEMAEQVWKALYGIGPVKTNHAFTISSARLFEAGLIKNRSPKTGSALHQLIQEAMDTAVDYGYLDIPKEGYYRAILKDPRDYEPEDWRMCLFNAIEEASFTRDQAIRKTAEWAKRNLGLQYARLSTSSTIWKSIDSEINQARKEGEIRETVFYGVVRIQRAM